MSSDNLWEKKVWNSFDFIVQYTDEKTAQVFCLRKFFGRYCRCSDVQLTTATVSLFHSEIRWLESKVYSTVYQYIKKEFIEVNWILYAHDILKNIYNRVWTYKIEWLI
jgi:hypothetical protein